MIKPICHRLTALLACWMGLYILPCSAIDPVPDREFESLFNLFSPLFPGIDRSGNVDLAICPARISLSGYSLPLFLHFSSDSSADRIFGSGWKCPILEANSTQVDESQWRCILPNGVPIRLYKTKLSETLRDSTGYWEGSFRGDNLILSHKNGTTIVYRKGKIQSAKASNGTELIWTYEGSRISGIGRPGATPILEVEYTESIPQKVDALKISGKSYKLLYDKRPIVLKVNDNFKVVDHFESSLARIILPNDKAVNFLYDVDERLNPRIDIINDRGEQRNIVWDPGNFKIRSDGAWDYTIEASEDSASNISVSRKNSITGKKEVIVEDFAKGIKSVDLGDGNKKTQTFFTSGFYGKLRSIVTTTASGAPTGTKFDYDEAGRLVRVSTGSIALTYRYENKSQNINGIQLNGETIWSNQKDKNANTVDKIFKSINEWRHSHNDALIENSVSGFSLKNGRFTAENWEVALSGKWQLISKIKSPFYFTSILSPSPKNEGRLINYIPATKSWIPCNDRLANRIANLTNWYSDFDLRLCEKNDINIFLGSEKPPYRFTMLFDYSKLGDTVTSGPDWIEYTVDESGKILKTTSMIKGTFSEAQSDYVTFSKDGIAKALSDIVSAKSTKR